MHGRRTRSGGPADPADRSAAGSAGHAARDPGALVRSIHADLARAIGHSVPLRLWDGSTVGEADAAYRIALHHPWALRRMLAPPVDRSAGEAYVHGDIDIEGDIVAAIGAGARVAAALDLPARARIATHLAGLPRPPRQRSRRPGLRGGLHSRARDRDAVSFHYDLPEAFYETFLDERLVYSCAYFTDPDEDLGAEQARKLDVICRKLRLRPGMRLLDIGCGWGPLLRHAALHHGVTGVGITLSRTQVGAARARLAREGLGDRVEIRLADYRELPDEPFDAVASVGMAEHAASSSWRRTSPSPPASFGPARSSSTT